MKTRQLMAICLQQATHTHTHMQKVKSQPSVKAVHSEVVGVVERAKECPPDDAFTRSSLGCCFNCRCLSPSNNGPRHNKWVAMRCPRLSAVCLKSGEVGGPANSECQSGWQFSPSLVFCFTASLSRKDTNSSAGMDAK